MESDPVELLDFRVEARQWLAAHRFSLPTELSARFARLSAWQRELYDAGYVGIAWPIEHGGRGLTQLHQLALFEELAVAQLPPPAALVGLEVLGPSLLKFGSPAQRERFLRPLLRGDEIWCQGFSEPGAGSDLAALATRARFSGDDLVVSGQKIWTSWAQFSQWCAVLVRTDPTAAPHKGISCVAVELSTPGVTVRPITQLTGEEEFSEVFFDEVRVPRSNLIGSPGDGWKIAMDMLANERGSFAVRRRAEVAGLFERALDELTDGADLDDTASARVGRATIALQVMEAQARRTADRLGQGAGPSPLDSVDKLVVTELEQEVLGCVMDLLGPTALQPGARPRGLDADVWAREYLYSRAGTIYGGTSQIQRNIVAQRLLDLPRG